MTSKGSSSTRRTPCLNRYNRQPALFDLRCPVHPRARRKPGQGARLVRQQWGYSNRVVDLIQRLAEVIESEEVPVPA